MVGQYGGWCWWGNSQLGGSGLLHGPDWRFKTTVGHSGGPVAPYKVFCRWQSNFDKIQKNFKKKFNNIFIPVVMV
jgi:phage pi2 protein 07